jgi:AcrR family transcriptional regulator
MSIPSKDRLPARERLLAAADELFYEEGVHSVGIDRVIERAGVAKATLYSAFGSKDDLVGAYLAARHAATRDRMTRELAARYHTPRERLLGVFDIQGEAFTEPGFRGCPFIGASAEARPGSTIEEAAEEHRAWVRSLFLDLALDLAKEANVNDPERLAQQLVLLYDGAGVAAWMDREPGAAAAARAVATALIDAGRSST